MNKIFFIILVLLLLAFATKAQMELALTCNGTTRPCIVENFDNILAMQFSITYDTSVYQFESIDFHPNIIDAVNGTNISNITLSWFDPTFMGLSLPDGSTLFTLNFSELSAGNPSVCFSEGPVPAEFIQNIVQPNALPLSISCNSITTEDNVIDHDLMIANDNCFNITHNSLANQYVLEGDFTNCNIFVLDENENVVMFLLNIFNKITIDFCDLPDGLYFIRIQHQEHENLFFQEIIKQ